MGHFAGQKLGVGLVLNLCSWRKKPRQHSGRGLNDVRISALARFIARVGFVDDIGAALAAHDFAINVALFQRLERVGDFHLLLP